jgi:hypothetical protein
MLAGVTAFAFSQAFQKAIEGLQESLNLPDYSIFLAIGLISVTTVILYLIVGVKRFIVRNPSMPMPDEDLRVVPNNNAKVQHIVQDELVPAIFGAAATPDAREVHDSFRHNSRRSIALYSETEGRYVGYAALWPIIDDVAEQMLRGEFPEERLLSKHILPSGQNAVAKYGLIPGIGVLGAGTAKGFYRGMKLSEGFRQFILDEFLRDPNREMVIFATAFTITGDKMCQKLKMTVHAMVESSDRKMHPVYARTIKRADLGSVSDLFFIREPQ